MHTMPCVPRGIGFAADLRVDNLGSGYTFAVASPGRAGATSSPFAVYVAFATVAAGGGHTCRVTTRNAVYCWGSNSWGELGIGIDRHGHPGGDLPSTTSVPVVGGLSFTSISLGVSESWGQLGDSAFGSAGKSEPVAVAGGHTFTTISAGGLQTCGVTGSGAAYCWGDNRPGQVGDGS